MQGKIAQMADDRTWGQTLQKPHGNWVKCTGLGRHRLDQMNNLFDSRRLKLTERRRRSWIDDGRICRCGSATYFWPLCCGRNWQNLSQSVWWWRVDAGECSIVLWCHNSIGASVLGTSLLCRSTMAFTY